MSNVSTIATSPAATGAAAPRQTSGSTAGGFEQLLQTPCAVESTSEAPVSAQGADIDPARDPSADQDVDADEMDATSQTRAHDAAEPNEDSELLQWPPPGLGGLALTAVATPPTIATSTHAVASADTSEGIDAALMASPAAAGQPSAAAGLALGPNTIASSAPAIAQTVVSNADAALQQQNIDTLATVAGTISNTAAGAETVDAARTSFAGLLPVAAADAPARLMPTSGVAAPDLSASIAVDDNFADAIGVRVGWLADQKIGQAHIRISPDALGTIDIQLQLDGDRVHASFSSANAEVRQALESSLGRLRDMLGSQGMQLANADVNDHASRHHAAPDQSPAGATGKGRTSGPGRTDAPATPAVLSRLSLLDTYA